MGAITYDMEITSPIPPAKMFKAFVLDADTLIPKILPQAIKNVKILEGDGGVGTVKLTSFGEGSQYKSMKQRVDGIDKENFTYSYSLIEGDALGEHIESISYEIKIIPSSDGGSICKNTSTYHTKADAQLTEEQINAGKEKIKAGKEKASNMFKVVEAYLLANPDA